MELKVENFDQFIQEQCKNAQEYVSKLEPLFKVFNFYDKSKTDRLMIQLAHAVQNLCRIALPAPSSAEFFGMPKEATEAADNPDVIVVDKDHPDWDFRPWFKGKINSIRDGFEGLLENYEKDPNELKLASNAGITSKEFLLGMLEHHLKVIRAYAGAVLSMFESGRLTVRDVRLEEEEE